MKTTSATIRELLSTEDSPLAPGSSAALEGSRSRVGESATNSFEFWKIVLLVLLAEAIAILAFYGFEWAWLRQMHVRWLQTTLQASGSHVQTAGNLLTVDGHSFQVDPDCTYVDLILCSLPLLWRFHRPPATNLTVMAGFAAAVVVVNLGRVLFGVYAHAHGMSLFWAHDLVDYVLWYPTMAVVAFLWLRSMSSLSDEMPIRREATSP